MALVDPHLLRTSACIKPEYHMQEKDLLLQIAG